MKNPKKKCGIEKFVSQEMMIKELQAELAYANQEFGSLIACVSRSGYYDWSLMQKNGGREKNRTMLILNWCFQLINIEDMIKGLVEYI